MRARFCRGIPASGSNTSDHLLSRLLCNKMIGPAEKHLRWQVSALLTAQRAAHDNRLEWELVDTGRNISSAAFALDDEQLAFLDSEGHHRAPSVGEYMANLQLENVDYPGGFAGHYCLTMGFRK